MNRASKLPVRWRSSSYSSNNGGQCLEVGEGITSVVPVRDSKAPDGPALIFTPDTWGSFVGAARRDEFPTV
ncbi:DUF397 domain-containing protein [Streptomyces sp. NPDC004610]|uniref:DUF397 domain-containing protein n=1 Tax=unclassified Streptomyces TaxID=2593676 RepID=UPI0033A2E376